MQHPLWAKELYGYAQHQPETESYGVGSFVYHARAPFDPARFHAFLTDGGLDGVIRAKGHFWLATRPDWVGELAVAGRQTTTARMGRWWAAVPKHDWPDDDRFERFVRQHWQTPWGDRRQELVFIGIGLEKRGSARTWTPACCRWRTSIPSPGQRCPIQCRTGARRPAWRSRPDGEPDAGAAHGRGSRSGGTGRRSRRAGRGDRRP
ncbi:MAG: GTP-binding protein [Sphingomonas taxi]